LHKIPICRHDKFHEVLIYLKGSGIELVACIEKADDLFYQHAYSNPVCVLMGNEYEGISPQFSALCDKKVRIPMVGSIESLNVSVATGIMLFEIVKNRMDWSRANNTD